MSKIYVPDRLPPGVLSTMKEDKWFEYYQTMLLQMVNTDFGREIFQIPRWIPYIVNIRKNCFHYYLGGNVFEAEFYSDARYANIVRANWDVFSSYARYFQSENRYASASPMARYALSVVASTLTAFPQADVATTAFDGRTLWIGTQDTIGNVVAKNGTNSDSNTTDISPIIEAGSTTNKYDRLDRGEMLFDTSTLTSSATLSAVMFSFVAAGKGNGMSGQTSNNSKLNIVASAPSSNTAASNGDFQAMLSTVFGQSDTQQNTSTSVYNDITLDANGLANVSKTAVSKYGARLGWDINATDSGLSWSSGAFQRHGMVSADAGGSSPKLTVTYTLPPSVTETNLNRSPLRGASRGICRP